MRATLLLVSSVSALAIAAMGVEALSAGAPGASGLKVRRRRRGTVTSIRYSVNYCTFVLDGTHLSALMYLDVPFPTRVKSLNPMAVFGREFMYCWQVNGNVDC